MSVRRLSDEERAAIQKRADERAAAWKQRAEYERMRKYILPEPDAAPPSAEPTTKRRDIMSNLEKIGWTDEARAAAAVARQKGYTQRESSSPAARQDFVHPNGHGLVIAPNGNWDHFPKGGTQATGAGSADLETHLNDVHKSRTEKNMSERVSFDNLILGAERPITKAADSVEFEFRGGVLRRVEVDMQLTSPKPTDATRQPANPASSFPRTASIVDRPVRQGDDSVRPIVEPYDLTAAGTIAPQFVADENFIPAGQGEMVAPANFVAPQPKDRTAADNATTGDFDEDDSVDLFAPNVRDDDDDSPVGKAVRLGSGYILKSEF